jgi:CheY-like chemotaxis protein
MADMPPYTPLPNEKDFDVAPHPACRRETYVLVVDDDHSIRETLRCVLEDEGYHVLEAPDGMAALDVLRATPAPTVVLLDLMMPRLDGVGMLSAVAHDPRLASQNAYIVITANRYRLDNRAAHLLTDLHVPVVPKPFDMDSLLDTVALAARRITTN